MNAPILLHQPKPRDGDPRRLHLFAGRALGEREFERLQAYVDDRVEPLLASLGAGIVRGFELRWEGAGAGTELHVSPGTGVAGNGALVRLQDPLKLSWAALLEQAQREADRGPLPDGLYLLTLRSAIDVVASGARPGEAATRREADPLRESQFEAVTLPGLAPAAASPRWAGFTPARAANRVLAAAAERGTPYRGDEDFVSIGLVHLRAGAPAWIDPGAARWPVGPHSAQRALLAHTVAQLAQWQQAWHRLSEPEQAQKKPLAALLGLDFLPAALPLPAVLLPTPARRQPQPGFVPGGMALELLPVPAGAVSGVMAAENRGAPIDLRPGARERLRLLLAVSDVDYRPDLMDWPQRDRLLEERLFLLGMGAIEAHFAWQRQWWALFKDADAAALKSVPAPAFLKDAPPLPEAVRDELVERRERALRRLDDQGQPLPDAPPLPLPEPYLSHQEAPHPPPRGYQPPQQQGRSEPGVLYRLQQARDRRKRLEELLERSFALLDEIDEYVGLQRAQADSLSSAFSALAGGVPGDGSGSGTLRWASQVKFAAAKAGVAVPGKP